LKLSENYKVASGTTNIYTEEDGILKLNRNLNEGEWKWALNRKKEKEEGRKKGFTHGVLAPFKCENTFI